MSERMYMETERRNNGKKCAPYIGSGPLIAFYDGWMDVGARPGRKWNSN